MRNTVLITLLLIVVDVISGCQSAKERDKIVVLRKDNEIDYLIKEVSKDSLQRKLQALQGFGTRYTHQKQSAVASYIDSLLREQHLGVTIQNYSWNDSLFKNIEVVLLGYRNPDRYFVIGAHYDSKSKTPGADDNGSGVAALLELARVMQNYSISNTIRIVFFSNEERGFHGSKSYVKYLQGLSGHCMGAIIVDMIGYCNDNRNLDIVTVPKCKWLAVTANEILQMNDISTTNLKIDKYCS